MKTLFPVLALILVFSACKKNTTVLEPAGIMEINFQQSLVAISNTGEKVTIVYEELLHDDRNTNSGGRPIIRVSINGLSDTMSTINYSQQAYYPEVLRYKDIKLTLIDVKYSDPLHYGEAEYSRMRVQAISQP